MTIFTEGRQKILAKTLMDFSKIFLAGVFTSEFLKASLTLRLILVVIALSLITAGFFTFPPKGGE